MTEQEKQLIETLKRSFTRMEAFYKAKSTRIRVYEEKISQLEGENAALHARLDKAVELPCKVGDTVYMPWIWGGTSGIANLKVCYITLFESEFLCNTDLESDDIDYKRKYNFGQFREYDFGVKVFVARESAEARFEELKGEK